MLFDLMVWLQGNPLGALALVILYLGLILALAQVLSKKSPQNPEIGRKVFHIGTGQVILLAWWLNIPAWIGISCSIAASIIAIVSYFVPILPTINSVGRKSLGTLFYALSIGILVAWFFPQNRPQYAALGILIMAWGDGLAALVGQRWGKHPYRWAGNQKSWEGSLTMAGASFLVSFLIILGVSGSLPLALVLGAIVSLTATILEIFSQWGLDNLTVPLGSAMVAFYLSQIFLPT